MSARGPMLSRPWIPPKSSCPRTSGDIDHVDGRTVEEAVGQLEWHDGDLIMVGSSRLSAPKRLFLGSKAAKMLRVLDVPMMVVPRDELGADSLP